MKRLVLVGILVSCTIMAFGQSAFTKAAKTYLEAGKYFEAISLIEPIADVDKTSTDHLILGISLFHTANYQKAYVAISKSMAGKKRSPVSYLYMAKTLHNLGFYEDAAENYKIYITKLKKEDPEFERYVDEVRRCGVNLSFKSGEPLGFVENMGKSVNSSYEEINPKQSPNFLGKYYFSSNREGASGGLRNAEGLIDEKLGKYKYDLFSVELADGNWTPVYAFNSLQNTSRNEYLQCFDTNGEILYFIQADHQNNSYLLVDTFTSDPEKRVFPTKISNGFRADLGDKDLQVFNDSLWIFASKRMGGEGGYDIYSMRRLNGEWQAPINMGTSINSIYNDESPFLTKGSRILFWSSNRLDGLGGYDLFYSSYSTSKKSWENAINLGAPINSAADESQVFISNDGSQGILASNRANGFGGSDLYIAYFKEQISDQLEFAEIPYFLQMDTISTQPNLSIIEDVTVSTSSNPDNKKTKFPNREFVNPYMLINASSEELALQSQVYLQNLKEIFEIYPNLNATIVVSNAEGSQPEFALFNSAKIGEKLVSQLTKNGISPSRFKVISLGNNFPLVNPEELSLSNKINNRASLIFHNEYFENLKIVNEEPTINVEFEDPRYAAWSKSMKGLSYSVHFATTTQLLRSDIVKVNRKVFISKDIESSNYKYNIGMFNTYNEARASKNELLRAGLIEAKVVVYLYGQEIGIDEIKERVAAFDDLKDYLKYENK